MIGVISKPDQLQVVEEFFELFKTPWEVHQPGRFYDVVMITETEPPAVQARLVLLYGVEAKSSDRALRVEVSKWTPQGSLRHSDGQVPVYCGLSTLTGGESCLMAGNGAAGVRIDGSQTTIRLGYDVFAEASFLLASGQPVEHAGMPTLDVHIQMLREWIVGAGIVLLEIPPSPAGYPFAACLTHDIDFIGIRRHKFDHTMWGFAYRATLGAVQKLLRGRFTVAQAVKSWKAALSLPFVFLGWAKDFWEPFPWFLRVEAGLPATYFLIPFKRHAGEKVPGRHPSRRATAYDVRDLGEWTKTLQQHGCELGVHGIDAWHSAEKGRVELAMLTAASDTASAGIRMHWLLNDETTPAELERAGYLYDSTYGYNETVGYRAGTGQVYRLLSAPSLLELPMHIQDGALFYPERLDLSEPEAERRCQTLIDNAAKFGGVLTLLWHDRSHGPERFWDDFYVRLVELLKSSNVWFGSAGQTVQWFQSRRAVRFERNDAAGQDAPLRIRYQGTEIQPPLTLRIHKPGQDVCDIPWNGRDGSLLERQLAQHTALFTTGVTSTTGAFPSI